MDISFQTNYWYSFPESNSDIILNLTHWQYWWWFWFTYLLCLYYFIFLRLIKYRTLKFHPKMVTSYRAHGKWGDFIICLLPISWCVNILSNSNFILRMIEWQTESNLFTVRIRGKQWYWVYKFEIKTLLNVLSIPKNIGHNNWTIFTDSNLVRSDDYTNTLMIKNNLNWREEYEEKYIYNLETNSIRPYFNTYKLHQTPEVKFNLNLRNAVELSKLFNFDTNTIGYKSDSIETIISEDLDFYRYSKIPQLNTEYVSNKNSFITKSWHYIDTNRYVRYNYFSKVNPLKVFFFEKKIFTKFNSSNTNLVEKNSPDNIYLVIKQKRFIPNKTNSYKVHPEEIIRLKKTFKSDENGILRYILIDTRYFGLNLVNLKAFEDLDSILHDKDITRRIYKSKKVKSTSFNHVFNRRLLRTKRTLVLPAHINITLITSSYDVVHSWFVPGLGLKIDCVPGRSTHHSFYIDNIGFYYGQCAEICGRYHHHMPIRVCALNYEHFLLWWQTKGLPRMYRSANFTKRKSILLNKFKS